MVAVRPTRSHMAENDALSKAIALYQEGLFQDALDAFEQESISKFKRVTRSATNKNFDRLIDALKDFKKPIDLTGDARPGSGRSRLSYTREEKLDASLRMVDSIMDLLQTSDKKRRTELQTLREEIVDSMRTQSVFDRLPAEVQANIFSFLMNGKRSGFLRLMLVCRTWKEIVYNTPSLWRRFDVDYRTTQKCADAWLKRARGIITSLRIEDSSLAYRKQNKFRRASKDFWSRVEELILGCDGLFKYLPEETLRQLRVHSLIVEREWGLNREIWDGICRLDTSNTRILVINFGKDRIELEGLPFWMLTTLELTGRFQSQPFFELLRRNVALETLIIDHKDRTSNRDFSEADEAVQLPILRRLELIGNGPFNAILRSVKMPNLCVLRIEKAYNFEAEPVLCIEAIHSQDIAGIHQFWLGGWPVPVPALIALLQSWTSLTNLKLSPRGLTEGSINSIIKAFYEPVSEPEKGTPSPILCPMLQYLSISSWHGHLDADTLVAFVKARNEKTEPATGDEAQPGSTSILPRDSRKRTLPILYLSVAESRSIDPKTIEWLRNAVPQFFWEASPRWPSEGSEWWLR